jgi:hypothetical protein
MMGARAGGQRYHEPRFVAIEGRLTALETRLDLTQFTRQSFQVQRDGSNNAQTQIPCDTTIVDLIGAGAGCVYSLSAALAAIPYVAHGTDGQLLILYNDGSVAGSIQFNGPQLTGSGMRCSTTLTVGPYDTATFVYSAAAQMWIQATTVLALT